MSVREDVKLLKPAEVEDLLRVHARTVSRWGRTGWLLSVRTLGGRRRYFQSEVAALMSGESREKARELALAERARLSRGRDG